MHLFILLLFGKPQSNRIAFMQKIKSSKMLICLRFCICFDFIIKASLPNKSIGYEPGPFRNKSVFRV